jgi:hypothetical protein
MEPGVDRTLWVQRLDGEGAARVAARCSVLQRVEGEGLRVVQRIRKISDEGRRLVAASIARISRRISVGRGRLKFKIPPGLLVSQVNQTAY